MKRCFKLYFIILLAIVLTGCGQNIAVVEEEGYAIYYVSKESTKVVAEQYVPESDNSEELINEFIAALQTDPVNVDLKKPISNKVNILNYSFEDEQVTLEFDEQYREIDPINEVLGRAAVVRTLSQIDGVNNVLFKVKGEPVIDAYGKPLGPMSADMFIDNTGEEINAYEKATLYLYFANEKGDKLVSTVKEGVVYNSNIPLEKLVTEQLVAGPLSGEVFPVVSVNTKINSVTVKDGICYLNLSDEFLNSTANVTEEVAVYAFANSLSHLPNINKVQISIDGNTNRMFREKISLDNLFERNLEIIATGDDSNS